MAAWPVFLRDAKYNQNKKTETGIDIANLTNTIIGITF